jgi:hypothetical protein
MTGDDTAYEFCPECGAPILFWMWAAHMKRHAAEEYRGPVGEEMEEKIT